MQYKPGKIVKLRNVPEGYDRAFILHIAENWHGQEVYRVSLGYNPTRCIDIHVDGIESLVEIKGDLGHVETVKITND